MDELIALVVEKTGISEQMAQTAVETVLEFLKEKLPDPIASQVDNVINGFDADAAGNVLNTLGGLFGKK